jgi:MFS family permease
LGILLSPVTGGQLADRYMPAQWLLVIANGIGAVALYMSSTFDYGAMPAGTAFWTLAGLLLLFSILYGPTLPLTNAVCFRHMSNIEKDFGKIRVWGTIGWMAAGLMLTAWRQESVVAETAKQAATWYGTIWNPISHSAGLSLVRLFGKTKPTDMLLLAAAFSALMAVLCTTLPDTPPERKGVEPLAFKKAFRMLRDTNFLIFMIISFVVTTVMWFYFIQTAPFLESIGVPRTDVPGWIATAQIGEIIAMVILLPLLLPRLGVRLCLVVGVLAWTIRYVVFTIGATCSSSWSG